MINENKKIWFISDEINTEEDEEELIKKEVSQFSQSFISRLWETAYFKPFTENRIINFLSIFTEKLIFEVNKNRWIFKNLEKEIIKNISNKILNKEKKLKIISQSEVKKYWIRKLKQVLSEELKFEIENLLKLEKTVTPEKTYLDLY